VVYFGFLSTLWINVVRISSASTSTADGVPLCHKTAEKMGEALASCAVFDVRSHPHPLPSLKGGALSPRRCRSTARLPPS
jgi:hypothetical protein